MSNLGGGINGTQPKGGLIGGGGGSKGSSGMEGGGARGMDRLFLRKARGSFVPNITFRTMFNASITSSSSNKVVFDSSDFTKYKRLAAKNRNYNDSSFGGSNNGAYVALMRVRH
jgi:hypothetical protein